MGRPPKSADAKRTERMSLYLTPDEAKKVKGQAEDAGVSLNQFLAWALAAGLIALGTMAISDIIKSKGGGSKS